VIVASSIKNKKQIDHIINALIVVGFINSILAICQYYNVSFISNPEEMIIDKINNRFRAYGNTGNPMFLAGWFATVIPLAGYRVYDFLKRKGWMNIWLYCYIAILLLEIIALMLTFTRGAIIAFFVTAFIGAIIISIVKKIKWIWVSSIVITVLFTLSVISLNLPSNPLKIPKNNVVAKKIFDISRGTDYSSLSSRFSIWKMVIKPIKDHFWLGMGPDAFGPFSFSKEYFDKELMKMEISNYQERLDRAHNIVLDSMLATGFLGTIFFLGIFFYIIIILYKTAVAGKNNPCRYLIFALFLSVLAYFLQGLTSFSGVIMYGLIFMIFAIVYSMQKPDFETEKEVFYRNETSRFSYHNFWYYLLIIPPLMIIGYLLLYPPILIELKLNQSLKMLTDPTTALDGGNLLFDTWEKNPRSNEINNLVSKLMTSSKEEIAYKRYENKLMEFKNQMPEEAIFPIALSDLYLRWADKNHDPDKFKLAENILNEGLNNFGNKYPFYTNQINVIANECNFERAEAKITEALEFSTYFKGHYYLAAALGAINCNNSAKEFHYLMQINDVYDYTAYSQKYYLLGNILIDNHDFFGAEKNWLECLEKRPRETICMYNLAMLYAHTGNNEKAINYAGKFRKINKKNGEKLINDINQILKNRNKAEADIKIDTPNPKP